MRRLVGALLLLLPAEFRRKFGPLFFLTGV